MIVSCGVMLDVNYRIGRLSLFQQGWAESVINFAIFPTLGKFVSCEVR